MIAESTQPSTATAVKRDSIEYRVAVQIARNRFGPGLDMGGAHNPRASEWRLAHQIVEDVLAEARLRATRLADSPFVKALSYPCNEPLHQQAKRNVDARLARLAQDHSPEPSDD